IAVLPLQNMAHQGVSIRATACFLQSHDGVTRTYSGATEQTPSPRKPHHTSAPGAVERAVAVNAWATFGEFAINHRYPCCGRRLDVPLSQLGDNIEMRPSRTGATAWAQALQGLPQGAHIQDRAHEHRLCPLHDRVITHHGEQIKR